jgi:hypothetical protein
LSSSAAWNVTLVGLNMVATVLILGATNISNSICFPTSVGDA